MSRIKEKNRLQALKALQIIDTPAEETFDDFAWLAATLCGVPISLVSLDDAERLWFKARCGLDLEDMPREGTFCSYAIEQDAFWRFLTRNWTSALPIFIQSLNSRTYASMPVHL